MNAVTVSALNTHIAALFEGDEFLQDIRVLGEVSNWKRAASGHIYFSLKDSGAAISAVMWKGNALNQSWLPTEGDQIVAQGYVSVYPERGVFQLYVQRIQPAGRGQLYEKLELLKAQLAAEGLFDLARKRTLPVVPHCIGIVTSADAAALRDILRVLAARWPVVEVVLFSTLVQGQEAPARIAAALAAANLYATQVAPIDTLILARGGGSIEDLWAFNSPEVAYAMAASQIPLITGIGHETDFTLADFVADLRAPTPSAAAAAAVPDRSELLARLAALSARLTQDALTQIDMAQRQLSQLTERLQRLQPQRQIDQQRQRLDDRQWRLDAAVRHTQERLRERQRALHLRLDALSPLAVLQRGYSIVQNQVGQVLSAPDQSTPGEALYIRSAGGDYRATRA